MGFFKEYFYNKKEMTESEYDFARFGFIVDSAAGMAAYSLVGGSYVAGLLAYLGASEAMSTFILSLSLFGGFFQILVPFLTRKSVHKKPFVMLCKFFDRLPMALMFFTPFIFGKSMASVVAVAVLSMIAFVCTYFMSPVHSDWLMKCLSKSNSVGKFSGIKEAVGSGAMMGAYFLAAQITKHFSGEKEAYAYLWLGIGAIILWAVLMTAMIFTKEPYTERPAENKGESIFEGLKSVFTYKKLRPFFTYSLIYYIGLYFMNSLVSVFCVQRMKISLELLSYLTMLDFIIRTVLLPVFGKLVDKVGSKKIIFSGLLLIAVSFGIYAFMTLENAIPLRIAAAVVSAVANAMLGASQFVLQMKSLPEENRTSTLAALSSILFLTGTISSWISTWFIAVANGFSIKFMGFDFCEMHIAFIIGTLIVTASALSLILTRKKAAE